MARLALGAEPLRLDVASEAEVAAVAERVGDELAALVNNAGIAVTAGPLFGPYSASKFALEAITDALRREVAPHGVRVVSVEPGGIATPIWSKGLARADELMADMTDDARRRYAAVIAAVRGEAERLSRVIYSGYRRVGRVGGRNWDACQQRVISTAWGPVSSPSVFLRDVEGHAAVVAEPST